MNSWLGVYSQFWTQILSQDYLVGDQGELLEGEDVVLQMQEGPGGGVIGRLEFESELRPGNGSRSG